MFVWCKKTKHCVVLAVIETVVLRKVVSIKYTGRYWTHSIAYQLIKPHQLRRSHYVTESMFVPDLWMNSSTNENNQALVNSCSAFHFLSLTKSHKLKIIWNSTETYILLIQFCFSTKCVISKTALSLGCEVQQPVIRWKWDSSEMELVSRSIGRVGNYQQLWGALKGQLAALAYLPQQKLFLLKTLEQREEFMCIGELTEKIT